MRHVLCRHDYFAKKYSTFSLGKNTDGEKSIIADIYNIEECSKCGLLHKEKLYTRVLYTVDEMKDFLVGEI